jgi:6-pyruvoyltetrahydropterin/6-carboxytetrahydropterin synthase
MYRLRVEKDYTGFSSAHFLTFNATKCARLHGHNYRSAVSIEGAANDDGYVIDFSELKRLVKDLCDQLDHRVLLPYNPLVEVTDCGGVTDVRFGTKHYRFPTDEVMLLPVPNTTAECLAQWMAERLAGALREGGAAVVAVEVEVEESTGQSASFRCAVDAPRELAAYRANAVSSVR